MSAPRIPNLLKTPRLSNSDHVGRGRGARRLQHASVDDIIRQTDDDAAGSRLSAVETGYLDDDFARTFYAGEGTPRRMPIINRGTYVRVVALDDLILSFIGRHAPGVVQIVSLGAGSDTRFFRLIQRDPSLRVRVSYHELDFADSVRKKIAAIESSPPVLSLISGIEGAAENAVEVSEDKTSLVSPAYCLHAVDLRQVRAGGVPQDTLRLRPEVPTVLLAEMCLTYLTAEVSSQLLSYFSETVIPSPTPLEMLLYEPLHPHDAFGRTMVQNLQSRGITLAGLESFPTLEAHTNRSSAVGFTSEREAWTQREWWERRVTVEEKHRLRGCEMVDEEEEWMLLAEHYGLIRGRR